MGGKQAGNSWVKKSWQVSGNELKCRRKAEPEDVGPESLSHMGVQQHFYGFLRGRIVSILATRADWHLANLQETCRNFLCHPPTWFAPETHTHTLTHTELKLMALLHRQTQSKMTCYLDLNVANKNAAKSCGLWLFNVIQLMSLKTEELVL